MSVFLFDWRSRDDRIVAIRMESQRALLDSVALWLCANSMSRSSLIDGS